MLRVRILLLCLVNNVLASSPWNPQNRQAVDCQGKVIYQVLTDRFAVSGGGSNTPCSDLSNYCGGKWAGITQRLDYIQGMGFDAIWISPMSASK